MRRRTLRLRDFNYSSARGYFFTSCISGKEQLLGSVLEFEVHFNPTGELVRDVWLGLPGRFSAVRVDEFIVMPDHVHGILFIEETQLGEQGVGAGLAPPVLKKGAPRDAPTLDRLSEMSAPRDAPTLDRLSEMSAPRDAPTLGHIIGAFKSLTAKSINTLLGRTGPVWQRNYYERVIRNEEELKALRKYIRENPIRWALRQTTLKTSNEIS